MLNICPTFRLCNLLGPPRPVRLWFYRRGYKSIANGNEFTCLSKIHFQKYVNIYSLNVDVVNLKRKFIYLGRRPSPSPLLSPDVLADVDVVDLKLSNETCGSHLGVTSLVLQFTNKFKGEERLLLINFYSDNVYPFSLIIRNCENLFHNVSNITVDLCWSHQYGHHWLHL
jgi:hypothetical protein